MEFPLNVNPPPEYAPKRLEQLLHLSKRFSLWGTFSPAPTIFWISAKLNNFPTSNIWYRYFHEGRQFNIVSNQACYHLFQMFGSNMHQNEWFQFWFFKHFLGRGSPSPLPWPLPRFFYGFALNSQALRFFESGFALDSLALRTLYSRLRPQPIWPSNNSWIRPQFAPPSQCSFPLPAEGTR